MSNYNTNWSYFGTHEKVPLLYCAQLSSTPQVQIHEWESCLMPIGHICGTRYTLRLLWSCCLAWNHKALNGIHAGQIHSLCNAQSTQFFKNLNFMRELAHITQQPASMCPKWPICFLESDNFRYCSIRSWVRETIGNRRVLPATNGNLSRNGNTFSAKNGPITLTLASPQNTTSYSLVISSIMNVFHAYVSRFFVCGGYFSNTNGRTSMLRYCCTFSFSSALKPKS